ncbi:metallophosphoesterase [Sinanaerobacter chloroacetimidivorans]|jgi:UDP-2,3-diacylglucosamine pyrophosphatase LpxH|uniref:Metallophosphoesterase n=1 Tax=Sinanaerobacter chloroacetimidivorans TaxID=2818044 RepID=A0A8J8B1H3_9FIRM|nr:metallophosphoesterase [Sinanaerobacter chloroacetimidivorans]MBR0598718.1 metallophosphoesterase [Sinanaerobacter chloroacetimidivorans]
MRAFKHLSHVFDSALEIPIDDSSRIVLMSDCHRGDGSGADDFSKNENIYYGALSHYYNEDYTYIELGDGDELWENKRINDIINAHRDVFKLLLKFYRDKRLYFIFGNHDIVKKNVNYVKTNLYRYFDKREKEFQPLFENITIHEGLVLRYKDTDNKILLIHGHQVDFLNNELWRLSRFLVRYLWRPLELFGIQNPTSPAENQEKKETVSRKLSEWVSKEKHGMVAGHNHRPKFAGQKDAPYFNDGSCVHPQFITAIEIVNGSILLVKWGIKTKADGTLYIGKEVIAGPSKLTEYTDRL